MKPTDNLENAIRNELNFVAGADLHDRMFEDILNAQEKSKTTNPAATKPNIRRIILTSTITKCAAAAVIGIAVLVSLPFFNNSNSVVLADVLAKVEQVRAFMYKIKVGTTTKQDISVTVSNEFGIKWETDAVDPDTGEVTTQSMYILPEQKLIVGLMPHAKQYMRMKLDDNWVKMMKKQNGDPRELSKEITGLSQNSGYLEYLRKELDQLKEEMNQSGELSKDEFRSVAIQKSMEMMKPLQSPGWFYFMLAKDKKEPAHYGESVGPNDVYAVLLRWRISDDEYRVIFAD